MTEAAPVGNTQSSGNLWRTAGGWIFVIVGVAGLLLPVLPGAPLLIAGLVLLSADYRWAQNCLDKVKLWTQKLYRHQAKPANDYPVMPRPEWTRSRHEKRSPQPATTSTKGVYHHETDSK